MLMYLVLQVSLQPNELQSTIVQRVVVILFIYGQIISAKREGKEG